MKKSLLLHITCLLLLSFNSYHSVNAASYPAAVTIPHLTTSGNPGTFGWSFIPNSDVFVTHLGVAFINGLQEVALWGPDGNLLASAVVASSDFVIDDYLAADYRYSEIPPIHLTAGAEYTLGVFFPSFTPIGDVNSAIVGAPEITVISDRFTLSSSLTMPTSMLRGDGLAAYVGPNMLITSNLVTTISIDIQPDDGIVDLKKDRSVKVAILTDSTFDATQVDHTTVLFGRAPAAPTRYQIKDVDRDGDADMLLTFNAGDTGIVCGDTDATLTGETHTGEPIIGTGTFIVVCP